MSDAPARGTLLIFGTGYIGEHVAQVAAEEGFAVLGTTRQLQRQQELGKKGVLTPLIFRGSDPISDDVIDGQLSDVTHVLSTIPPKAGSDPVLAQHARNMRRPYGM